MWGSPESYYTNDQHVPETFRLKLLKQDDKLFMRWNNVLGRWEVWRWLQRGISDAYDRKVMIMPVKFGSLDGRILAKLKECDLWRYRDRRYGRCNDITNDWDAFNDAEEKRREDGFKDKLDRLTKQELFPTAVRRFGNPKSRSNWSLGGIRATPSRVS